MGTRIYAYNYIQNRSEKGKESNPNLEGWCNASVCQAVYSYENCCFFGSFIVYEFHGWIYTFGIRLVPSGSVGVVGVVNRVEILSKEIGESYLNSKM